MKLRILLLLCALFFLPQHQLIGQSYIDSLAEKSVMDTIWNLKEVQKRNEYVIQMSKGKRNLSVLLYKNPEETKKGNYWVKIVEDNGTNLVSHFNFFVYPIDGRIVYFDTVNDKEIEVSKWRNRMNKNKQVATNKL
jgi:hypothetical protein